MRLNKFLAHAGVASRRGSDQLIKQGDVSLNGKVVREMGIEIDPAKDKVTVGGQVVGLAAERVIYLLNKPAGVVTTADDPQGRKTVLDFVPKEPRVFACGRLDYETTGLVVLTNDGELCNELTHPKFEHKKEYLVEGYCRTPQESTKKLLTGVRLKDGPAKADEIKIQKASGNVVRFAITVHEGRNRIVRRMCAAANIEVRSLSRLSLGEYQLGNLPSGQYIKL